MWSLESIYCISFLTICTIIDIRHKNLPAVVFITAAAGSAATLMIGGVDWILAVGGLLTGVFCLLISKVTREGLGYGDSLLILCMGAGIGLWKIIAVLLIAFFSAAIYSIFLLAIRYQRREYRYPFVPFLLIGYMGAIWI